jgi:hypothetical protein
MIGKVASFAAGMAAFWAVILVAGLLILGAHGAEHHRVPAQAAIEERQRQEVLVQGAEEEARQAEYRRLGIK